MEIINNNNTGNVGGGSSQQPSPTEKVPTTNDQERRKWWEIFIYHMKKAWNGSLYQGMIPNHNITNDWHVNHEMVIGVDGAIRGPGFPTTHNLTLWDYDNVTNPDYASHESNRHPICYIITKGGYTTLCKDLGTNLGVYDDLKTGEFLKKIYNLLQTNEHMPKAEPCHDASHYDEGNSSGADGRWLTDYIDVNDSEIFGPMWESLGVDEETRKATLVKHANDKEAAKRLYDLLKVNGKNFDEIWNERETSNQSPPPESTQNQKIPKDDNQDNINNKKNDGGEREENQSNKSGENNQNEEEKDVNTNVNDKLGNERKTNNPTTGHKQENETITEITGSVGPKPTQIIPKTYTATLSNNNIIESPSQNPPPKTDTFTRTTKRVNNASPKDQDWHLSTDWECVTVW